MNATRFDAHLVQPLIEAAQIAEGLASKLCTADHGTRSCFWYHAPRPLFRALDVVANPYWHYDFYTTAFKLAVASANKPALNIGVFGAAEFSAAAIAAECAAANGVAVNKIIMIDRCATALELTRRYIQGVADFVPILADLTTGQFDLGEGLDIIISDALLTRFEFEERKRIIECIFNSLSQNGSFISTTRDYLYEGKPEIDPQGQFIQKCMERIHGFKELASFQDACEYYAGNYILRKLSSKMVGPHDLYRLIDPAKFVVRLFRPRVVTGEPFSSVYQNFLLTRLAN